MALPQVPRFGANPLMLVGQGCCASWLDGRSVRKSGQIFIAPLRHGQYPLACWICRLIAKGSMHRDLL